MRLLSRLRRGRTAATTAEPEPGRSPEIPWQPLKDAPDWVWGVRGRENESQWHRRIRRGREERDGD